MQSKWLDEDDTVVVLVYAVAHCIDRQIIAAMRSMPRANRR